MISAWFVFAWSIFSPSFYFYLVYVEFLVDTWNLFLSNLSFNWYAFSVFLTSRTSQITSLWHWDRRPQGGLSLWWETSWTNAKQNPVNWFTTGRVQKFPLKSPFREPRENPICLKEWEYPNRQYSKYWHQSIILVAVSTRPTNCCPFGVDPHEGKTLWS